MFLPVDIEFDELKPVRRPWQGVPSGRVLSTAPLSQTTVLEITISLPKLAD
jgi:hypothetical protein